MCVFVCVLILFLIFQPVEKFTTEFSPDKGVGRMSEFHDF